MPRAVTRSSTSVASTRRAKAPAAKKVISKRASAQPKKVAKKSPATKAVKKEPVRPKKTALTREDRALAKTLDLCLILDCTGSMHSWI